MLIDLLRMDLKRSLDLRKVIPVVFLIVFFMIFGEDEFFYYPETLLPWNGYSRDYSGILANLQRLLYFDKYKVVFVILLCSLYSASFCKDKSNGYIRMVLSRTDVTSYTQSKFIANTVSIILASLCSFFLYALILLPTRAFFNPENGKLYYMDVMQAHPVCYLVMAGLQFGMVTAACGGIGMLVSTFQPDAFVSIGLPGLVFFLALSFQIQYEGPLDISSMVGMERTLTIYTGGPEWLDYLWGITLPFLVICLLGFLFNLRLTQRIKNGEI